MPMGVWYSAVLHGVRGFPYLCVHLIQDVKVHRRASQAARRREVPPYLASTSWRNSESFPMCAERQT